MRPPPPLFRPAAMASPQGTNARRRRLLAGVTLTAIVTWKGSDASAGAAIASDAASCCPWHPPCSSIGICAGPLASLPVNKATVGGSPQLGRGGREGGGTALPGYGPSFTATDLSPTWGEGTEPLNRPYPVHLPPSNQRPGPLRCRGGLRLNVRAGLVRLQSAQLRQNHGHVHALLPQRRTLQQRPGRLQDGCVPR
jgi:hypothetical protein